MDNKLKETVEKNLLGYLNNKVILPLLKDSFNHDERCYNIFTKELADIFSEYQPEYFENDYHSRVGQYYFSAVYGDYVPEEMLIEIIKADQDERFDGLDVIFSNYVALDAMAEDSVVNYIVNLDHVIEMWRIITLFHLNKEQTSLNKYINTY